MPSTIFLAANDIAITILRHIVQMGIEAHTPDPTISDWRKAQIDLPSAVMSELDAISKTSRQWHTFTKLVKQSKLPSLFAAKRRRRLDLFCQNQKRCADYWIRDASGHYIHFFNHYGTKVIYRDDAKFPSHWSHDGVHYVTRN